MLKDNKNEINSDMMISLSEHIIVLSVTTVPYDNNIWVDILLLVK